LKLRSPKFPSTFRIRVFGVRLGMEIEERETKGNDFNAFFNLLQNAICKTAVIAHMFQFHSKAIMFSFRLIPNVVCAPLLDSLCQLDCLRSPPLYAIESETVPTFNSFFPFRGFRILLFSCCEHFPLLARRLDQTRNSRHTVAVWPICTVQVASS
jgi:hypothetical protein